MQEPSLTLALDVNEFFVCFIYTEHSHAVRSCTSPSGCVFSWQLALALKQVIAAYQNKTKHKRKAEKEIKRHICYNKHGCAYTIRIQMSDFECSCGNNARDNKKGQNLEGDVSICTVNPAPIKKGCRFFYCLITWSFIPCPCVWVGSGEKFRLIGYRLNKKKLDKF